VHGVAQGAASHAEGSYREVIASYAHAEGAGLLDSNYNIHLTGTTATNTYTVVGGNSTNVRAGRYLNYNNELRKIIDFTSPTVTLDTPFSVNLNDNTVRVAFPAAGNTSHVEGMCTIADGPAAHAEGMYTLA